MRLIGSLGAMWAWWGKQFHEPKCGPGHLCRVMAWTRQQGLVPSSEILFFIFFFHHLYLFDDIRLWLFLDWTALFLLFFVLSISASHYEHNIFRCQIPFLYPDCIFLYMQKMQRLQFKDSNSFSFFANCLTSTYIRRLIFFLASQ